MGCAQRYDLAFVLAFFASLVSARHFALERGQSELGILRTIDVQSDGNRQNDNILKHENALANFFLLLHPANSVTSPRFIRQIRSSRKLMGFMDNLSPKGAKDKLLNFRDEMLGDDLSPEGLKERFLDVRDSMLEEKYRPAREASAALEATAKDFTIDFVPTQQLPDSYDDAVSIAVESVAAAVSDGYRKIWVDVVFDDSGDITAPRKDGITFVENFLTPFVDAVATNPNPRVQLVFADNGKAVYANANMRLPDRTLCDGLNERLTLAKGVDALVILSPMQREFQILQKFVEEVESQSPETIILLVNPELLVNPVVGNFLGEGKREKIANFQRTFNNVFSLMSYAVGAASGVIYRVWPEGWSAWLAEENEYNLIYAGSSRPERTKVFATDGQGIAGFVKDMQSL